MRPTSLFKCCLIAWMALSIIGLPSGANAHVEEEDDWQYIDLGEDGDVRYIVTGFAEPNISPFVCDIHPGLDDYSARYQQMGQDNIIEFLVEPGQDLHLSFCVEQGYAQDDWELLVNGHTICQSLDEIGLPHHYDVVIPGEHIDDSYVAVHFLNTSTDFDGANTYGIRYRQ